MKITHLCLACFFPDGFSYQENLLPKYHKILGHDVTVIASLQTFNKSGKIDFMPGACEYVNENDVRVVRLDYKKPTFLYRKLKQYVGLAAALEKSAPDVIFIHGCQFLDSKVVVQYVKRHKDVVVYVDNHADFGNSARNWVSLNLIHRILWRRCAQRLEPYVRKFYGVLPVRVDFLKNVYRLSPEKIELLVMGADDEWVERAYAPGVTAAVRNSCNIREDDFLIVTGGKIKQTNKQILLLMEAVNNLAVPNVKLIVFGSVFPELRKQVEALTSDRVQYIGWIDSADTYKYFAAANLVVLPGLHSVFWEQAAGLGKPMLCKSLPGTKHIDLGGNVRFIEKDTIEEMCTLLKEITETTETYAKMAEVAQQGKTVFSYREIAKRSLA